MRFLTAFYVRLSVCPSVRLSVCKMIVYSPLGSIFFQAVFCNKSDYRLGCAFCMSRCGDIEACGAYEANRGIFKKSIFSKNFFLVMSYIIRRRIVRNSEIYMSFSCGMFGLGVTGVLVGYVC